MTNIIKRFTLTVHNTFLILLLIYRKSIKTPKMFPRMTVREKKKKKKSSKILFLRSEGSEMFVIKSCISYR